MPAERKKIRPTKMFARTRPATPKLSKSSSIRRRSVTNRLLDVFWSNHNPTTLNRQGPDVGAQYRSVIFYHSPEQKAAAEASKEKIDKSGRFPRPIVTQIEPAPKFWRAEEYHQRYLEKRGQSHCANLMKWEASAPRPFSEPLRNYSDKKFRGRRREFHCRSCAQSAGRAE